MSAASGVQACLRTTEILKATLETYLLPATSLANPTLSFEATDLQDQKRTLAVVSHTSYEDNLEQGGIIIFKPGRADSLPVDRTYALVDGFSVKVGQSRRETSDLSSNSNLSQPRLGFTLTITPGDTPGGVAQPLTLHTDDAQALKTVLSECRRLQEIARNAAAGPSQRPHIITYSWLSTYTRRNLSNFFSALPPDLRTTTQAVHTRLSPASAGNRGSDASDIALIREEWVRQRARKACNSTTPAKLRIRVGTFNVNGKVPSQDLSGWVGGRQSEKANGSSVLPAVKPVSPFSMEDPPQNPLYGAPEAASETSSVTGSFTTLYPASVVEPDKDVDEEADMLVLGFQELDLSAEALIYSTSTAKADAWCTAVLAGLGEYGPHWEKLASKQLVGMLLVVFVKSSAKACFGDVKLAAAGSGIMGVMGNKGGTAIRLTYTPPPIGSILNPSSTVLTFVNAHLAAFDEMVDKRNADYQYLAKKLGFDADAKTTATGELENAISLFESHVLIWMGDLNYRVDLPDYDIRSLLQAAGDVPAVDTLTRYDQLKNAIRARQAFEGFQEPRITHLPTYRFGYGLLMDALGYDRKRKPAWTDRILYMTAPEVQMQLQSYRSHGEINMSDHRPVSSQFSISFDVFDQKEYERHVRGIYHKVSDFENLAEQSKIKVEPIAVELGTVSYKRRIAHPLVVQNRGRIPCAYRFVPLERGKPINPEWMSIEPLAGIILPGEKASITLMASVDERTASQLNLQRRELECTLILHTALGKDHFISVSGMWEYTCFGNSLERLARLPGPIWELKSPEDLLPEAQAINAPREVMRLVNWMMSHADGLEELFLAPADADVVRDVRECLDTGVEFSTLQASSKQLTLAVGEALLQLLRALPEPVVPRALHAQCAEVASRDEAYELLDGFSSAAVNVWISVTAFVNFVGQQSSINPSQLDADEEARISKRRERLASVFAPVLLRDDSDDPEVFVSPLRKREFLLYFI